MPISYYSRFVLTIVIQIEDKVSADLLVVFRSLNNAHVFVGVTLVLFIYFQLDVVSTYMIAVLFIYVNSMIIIITARDPIPKLAFGGAM